MTRRVLAIMGWVAAALAPLPGCKLLSPGTFSDSGRPALLFQKSGKSGTVAGPGAEKVLPQHDEPEEAAEKKTPLEVMHLPDLVEETPVRVTTSTRNVADPESPFSPESAAEQASLPAPVSPYHPSAAPLLTPTRSVRQADYFGKRPVDAGALQPDKITPPGDDEPIRPVKNTKTVEEPVGPVLAPVRKEPLVLALDLLLQQHPEQALDQLKGYDSCTQEVFQRLLPVLAQLTRKPLKELDEEQTEALYQQLDLLMGTLRSRANLMIDRMCFCESIESYGVYKPLAEDHAFRPGTPQQPGELVQIYVQLRNLCPEKCAGGYETRLASSVQVHDPDGNQVWYYNFQEREPPLRSQTLRRDYCNNYSFYVPHLPPGSYTLTIEVRDLTRPDAQRTVRKSVPFRVGM